MVSESSPNVPARAQRSVLGMVGALLVLLVVIGAFVIARSALRDNAEVRPTPVDYTAAIDAAQANGITVFYPLEIPEGWVVTSVKLPFAAGQPWGLGMLTDTGQFVGVRQEAQTPDDLAEDRLGEDARITTSTPSADGELTGWRTVVAGDDFAGDSALIAVADGESVLVYGSAEPSTLARVASSLTAADR